MVTAKQITAVDVVISILAVITLMANGTVCILVFTNRNLRTYTNGFIVSLAVSDILVGVALFLQYALSMDNRLVLNVLFTTALVGSVANLTAVTFDRHLACTQPFDYQNIIARYFIKIVAFCWTAAVISALLPLSWLESNSAALALRIYQFGILIICIVAPYTWIFLCYLRLFWQVHKIVKRERKMAVHVRGAHQCCERTKRVCSEAKIAKVFCVIAFLFVVSWLPIIWTTFVYAIGKPYLMPKVIHSLSSFTLAVGSVINPILYSFLKPDFRNVYKNIFRLIPRGEKRTYKDHNAFSRATNLTKSASRLLQEQTNL